MLEIGARQLNNWRLHEPPEFLPFCESGALPTRLHCSLVPRHHFQLPGRYSFASVFQPVVQKGQPISFDMSLFEDLKKLTINFNINGRA